LASISEAILKSTLDHVIVVQPAVGFHNLGLAFTATQDEKKKLLKADGETEIERPRRQEFEL
jgi:hypothetical protein